MFVAQYPWYDSPSPVDCAKFCTTGEIQTWFCQLERSFKVRVTDRREPHVLDVIELVDQALPCASTVLVQVTWRTCRAIGTGKAVSDDLVNRLRSPLLWC